MELVTKKSECRGVSRHTLVKSPKEAMRKTLKNSLIKDGLVVKLFPASFISNNRNNESSLWG